MGAEHAFLGHDCEKDLVGGHLGFGTYDLEKCFSVGNISSALEYDEMINGGKKVNSFHFCELLLMLLDVVHPSVCRHVIGTLERIVIGQSTVQGSPCIMHSLSYI